MTSLLHAVVLKFHNCPLKWQEMGLQETTSGYGSRLTTRWKVKYLGRARRVYCTQYANLGTLWINVKGKRVSVEMEY